MSQFLQLQAVEVELDAVNVISLLSISNETNGDVSSIIDYCRNILSQIPQVSVNHCFREANRSADALSRMGSKLTQDFIIFDFPPSDVIPFLYTDSLGLPVNRLCNVTAVT